MREEGKNTRSIWWQDEVKVAVRRKEAARKEMSAANDEKGKEKCRKRTEKRKVKRCIYQIKNKLNEQFGRKINEDVNRNRKSFRKEVSNVKGGKVENSSRIKDGNGRLAQGEDEVRRIWK